MKNSIQRNLPTLSESINLSLLVLQTFDIYSYQYFFEELKKKDKNNKLFFIVTKLRLIHQMSFLSSYYNKKFTRFLKEEDITIEDIKAIILTLTKVINSNFFKQKLDLLCFYFLPEKNLFSTLVKINQFKNLDSFDYHFFINTKHFSFLFMKTIPNSYTKKTYKYFMLFYLQCGLRYLDFYKNL